MKKVILSLALAFSSFAAHAGPAEAVADTVTRLIAVLNIGSDGQRAASMCQLVKSRVDVAGIGPISWAVNGELPMLRAAISSWTWCPRSSFRSSLAAFPTSAM